MKPYCIKFWAILLGVSLVFVSAIAMSDGTPQITGEPGSPSATTTINGKQLPPVQLNLAAGQKETRHKVQMLRQNNEG